MTEFNDPGSLIGFHNLLNTEGNDDIDIQQLEKELSGKHDNLDNIFQQAEDETNNAIMSYRDKIMSNPKQQSFNIFGSNQIDDSNMLNDIEPNIFSDNHNNKSNNKSINQYSYQKGSSSKPSLTDLLEESDDDNDDDYSHSNTKQYVSTSHNNQSNRQNNYPFQDPTANQMTDEQKKSQMVSNLLRDISVNNDNSNELYQLTNDEEKLQLINDIENLMDALQDEKVDLKDIQVPTKNSSLGDILDVKRRLQLKLDRHHYKSFGTEFFLAGAQIAETLFDGEKEYFGRRPNLQGWSDTVNVKLRRMKYDTSSFMAGVMKDMNAGSGVRILMELGLSALIYSRVKKRQDATNDTLYDQQEMNAALDTIMNDSPN